MTIKESLLLTVWYFWAVEKVKKYYFPSVCAFPSRRLVNALEFTRRREKKQFANTTEMLLGDIAARNIVNSLEEKTWKVDRKKLKAQKFLCCCCFFQREKKLSCMYDCWWWQQNQEYYQLSGQGIAQGNVVLRKKISFPILIHFCTPCNHYRQQHKFQYQKPHSHNIFVSLHATNQVLMLHQKSLGESQVVWLMMMAGGSIVSCSVREAEFNLRNEEY